MRERSGSIGAEIFLQHAEPQKNFKQMNNKPTLKEFRQKHGVNEPTKRQVIGGHNTIPLGLGSTGMISWGDVDIRSRRNQIDKFSGFWYRGFRRTRP